MKTFSVIEYTGHYSVRNNQTGQEHVMGDGVDTIHDENGKAELPGTEEFRAKWEEILNDNESETMEAYFPGEANLCFSEVREKWESQNRVRSYEGANGVRNLEKLCDAMGYDKQGEFVNADSIWNFLSDNPGAMEAIINWIDEQENDDWKDSLLEDFN